MAFVIFFHTETLKAQGFEGFCKILLIKEAGGLLPHLPMGFCK